MQAPTVEKYRRARRLASIAAWTVALQARRLTCSETEDESFVLRKWADFDFLIVALTRLRRAAVLASSIPEIRSEIEMALSRFDSKLPHLKKMRDVAEHIDDDANDSGRDSTISRASLEVGSLSGTKFKWLGFALDTEQAMLASQALFDAIKRQAPSKIV